MARRSKHHRIALDSYLEFTDNLDDMVITCPYCGTQLTIADVTKIRYSSYDPTAECADIPGGIVRAQVLCPECLSICEVEAHTNGGQS